MYDYYSGAMMNAQDESGRSPLMAALFRRHFKVVKLLIEAGANINAKDVSATTALIYMLVLGHLEVELVFDVYVFFKT